jgi:Uma2 family endonuclease
VAGGSREQDICIERGVSMTMPAVARKTPAAKADSGQRIVLYGIDWKAYKTICDAVVDRHVRMTYDGRALEIMVTSFKHDRYSGYFALIIFTIARFYRRKIANCGSFTHQRDDLKRGFEPDQCFYLANLAAIKGKKEIDLSKDPPPDLSIEVDVSRSSLDRMAIFAAFGVPEVWRFDGKTIQVYVLKNGSYEAVAASPTFPEVPIAGLVHFLELGVREDDTTMVEELEKWLAKLPSGKPPSTKRKRGK